MRSFTAVIEKCSDTGLYVGYVPGFAGAHSQADTLEELNNNLREVIEMLLEDGGKRSPHDCTISPGERCFTYLTSSNS